MLLSSKARFLLFSSFQSHLKLYMLQVALQLNQQQFYMCLYNSLYAKGLFCLNCTGLETPDHRLLKAGLYFTSLASLGGKQSSATSRTKVLLQNGVQSNHQVAPWQNESSNITLVIATYILERVMLDEV